MSSTGGVGGGSGRRSGPIDTVAKPERRKVGYTGADKSWTGLIKDYKGTGPVDVVFPPGIELKSVTVNLRTTEQTHEMRAKFNSSIRKNWMKKLGKEQKAALLAAGISEADIKAMAEDGIVPDTHRVHHKVPLEWGGSNEESNFVLIQNDPFHKALTSAQNMKTDVTNGQTVADWPTPAGIVFPSTVAPPA
jgi:hypothetical protein